MRIVVARMPVPLMRATCGAASCLDPHSPESSPPRRPFRFHASEDASENPWPRHIWPERIKAVRRTQRRTLRPPGGMRSGVQPCRRRFVRRCGPGVIHSHHCRFPPSVIVSADGRRDRSPVRASIIGPRLVARFPARTGADMHEISQHDNSRHKVTRAGTSRNHGPPRADHHPFSFPTVPGLPIHRGGIVAAGPSSHIPPRAAPGRPPGRPGAPAVKPAQDNESTNQLGKADV